MVAVYVFVPAFVGCHVIAGIAFAVTGRSPGLSWTGLLTAELALVDMLMDFLYFFTNPFATEGLYTACYVVLIISQIVPAIMCFMAVTGVTFKDGAWQYPWGSGWKLEDMSNFFFMIITVLFNVFMRPTAAVFMSVLFAVLWNMKLLPSFLKHLDGETTALNILGLTVYNELILENIPQLYIQAQNNSQLNEWTLVAVVSFTTSIIFVCKSLFEPTFQICVLRRSIAESFSSYFQDGAQVSPTEGCN